jgi:hypothetical protein
MIGAISSEPAMKVSGKSAFQVFIDLCERKGDYSFIYSATRRSSAFGREWMPTEDVELPVELRLPPIIHWHLSGARQSGGWEGDIFSLHDVVLLQEGPLTSQAKFRMQYCLGHLGTEFSIPSYPCFDPFFFDILCKMGFEGSPDFISTDSGYFFPVWTIEYGYDTVVEVIVSLELIWVFGAPGLTRVARSQTGQIEYIPGVFFGFLQSWVQGRSICLGS